jgi:hypothetical protein
LKHICTTHDFTELKLNNNLLFTFYSSIQMNSPFSCYFLDLGHHHNTGKFCDSDVKSKSLNIVPVCGVVCEFVIKLYVGETGDSWYSTERDMP